MMFSLSMIVIFPVTGWLIDYLGFSMTFIYLGSFLLLITPLLKKALSKIDKHIHQL